MALFEQNAFFPKKGGNPFEIPGQMIWKFWKLRVFLFIRFNTHGQICQKVRSTPFPVIPIFHELEYGQSGGIGINRLFNQGRPHVLHGFQEGTIFPG